MPFPDLVCVRYFGPGRLVCNHWRRRMRLPQTEGPEFRSHCAASFCLWTGRRLV